MEDEKVSAIYKFGSTTATFRRSGSVDLQFLSAHQATPGKSRSQNAQQWYQAESEEEEGDDLTIDDDFTSATMTKESGTSYLSTAFSSPRQRNLIPTQERHILPSPNRNSGQEEQNLKNEDIHSRSDQYRDRGREIMMDHFEGFESISTFGDRRSSIESSIVQQQRKGAASGAIDEFESTSEYAPHRGTGGQVAVSYRGAGSKVDNQDWNSVLTTNSLSTNRIPRKHGIFHGFTMDELSNQDKSLANLIEIDRQLEQKLYLSGETESSDQYEEEEYLSRVHDAFEMLGNKVGSRSRNHSGSQSSQSNERDSWKAKRSKYVKWFKSPKKPTQLHERDDGDDFASVKSFQSRLKSFVAGSTYTKRKAEEESLDCSGLHDPDLYTLSAPFDSIHRRNGPDNQTNEERKAREEETRRALELAATETRAREQVEKAREEERKEADEKYRKLMAKLDVVKEANKSLTRRFAGANQIQVEKDLEWRSKSTELENALKLLHLQVNDLELQVSNGKMKIAEQEEQIERKEKEIVNINASFARRLEQALQSQQEAEWAKKLTRGGVFIKHGRKGRPHKALVYCDKQLKSIYYCNMNKLFGTITHSMLSLDAVEEIRHGIKTEVLRRSGNAERVFACFSLVWKEYTLDLELPYYPKDHTERDRLVEATRNEWLAALRWAVAKNRPDLNENETSAKSQLPSFPEKHSIREPIIEEGEEDEEEKEYDTQ